MCFCVFVCVSIFVTCDTISVPIGPMDRRKLVFEWQGVGLADVHPILLCLQILVVAFVFVIIVLSLAVMGGGMAGQRRGRWHRGWSGVTEA